MQESTDFRVELEQFSGPLELLLHLLREEELSVEGIQVARVCDRYLEHLGRLERIDLDAAGEFLLMAATLMRLKSRSLLPQEEQMLEEDDLDPRFELVRQLIEYRRFRRAAERLAERGAEAALQFARGMHPERREALSRADPAAAAVEDATAERLFAAFARLLRETQLASGYVVSRDDTPLEDHVRRLENLLAPGVRATFGSLFEKGRSRAYAIGVFLALLELLKRGRLAVEQDGEFGEIRVEGRDPPPPATSPASPAAPDPGVAP